MTLRVTQLEAWPFPVHFRFAYAHALAARSEGINILVRVQLNDGSIGWGEAIPRAYLTGETVGGMLARIKAWREEIYALHFDAPETLLATVAPLWHQADTLRETGAWAGVELALIDAITRAHHVPAWRVLATESICDRIAYTAPLGFRGMKKTRWGARLFSWLGFHQFKLKTGWPDDAQRIASVRKIIGEKADLRVDANTGWNMETALELAPTLREHAVSSVEQPFPANALGDMARFQNETGIAVMADESLCTMQDARDVIAAKACRIFNIRLAKCGGFSGCRAMLQLAQAEGVTCQLGALVGETSILTAAAQHFIAACGPLQHHEQNFPRIFLKNDPARGARAPLWGGQVRGIPSEPGLGIRIITSI